MSEIRAPAKPEFRRPDALRRRLARLPLELGLLALAASSFPRLAWARPTSLDKDEDVLFLPSIARMLDNGQVEVDLQAWIYEKERAWLLDAGLARYLGVKLDKLSATDRLRFVRRTELFHTEPEDGKTLKVEFGRDTPAVTMPRSNEAGRTGLRAVVAFKSHGQAPLFQPTLSSSERAVPWVRFHALVAGTPPRRVEGRALLVPSQGLSVVSDIDDTVKKTDVLDRQQMMLNTFVRPFEAVPGMARRYRNLARKPDTCFHYLSSSPLQLLPSLRRFLSEAKFPPGSLHLRESTRRRDWIPGDGESRTHKLGVLERLIKDLPGRRFLLVGDSGERDPEIYGEIARAHPDRIDSVLIRDLTGEARNATRYASAFAEVPDSRWHLFKDGEDWPLG